VATNTGTAAAVIMKKARTSDGIGGKIKAGAKL
jgi:hypothetical protein